MVSVIVPAYNEVQLIGGTLDALAAAGAALGEPFEVVVTDDASADRTAAVAREHGARVVAVDHRQIAATRNAGAKASSGEMLVFVDADTVVTTDAVRAAVAAMRAGAVGEGCSFRFDEPVPLHGRFLERTFVPLYRLFRLASGCFLFCTRRAFDAVGGFNEALFAGEELAMSRALGRVGRFVVLRESVTTSGRRLRAHSARETFGLLARLLLAGEKGLRTREGKQLWYGDQRSER